MSDSDRELASFNTIGPVLDGLDDAAQARVLRWATTRLEDKIRQRAAAKPSQAQALQKPDIQMPGSHLKLMAVFLELYGDEASNRSCNDFDLEKNGGLTPGERESFLCWAVKEDAYLEDVDPSDSTALGDNTIANLLAGQLKKILGGK